MLKLEKRILSRFEIAKVVAHLRHTAPEFRNTHRNLIIFRLACCCGLSRKEIADLQLSDVVVETSDPYLVVRKKPGQQWKRTRSQRTVPLDLDRSTLQDLYKWRAFRIDQCGGELDVPFVCGQCSGSVGHKLKPEAVAKMWKTAIKCLGPERVREVSIFSGRHSFIAHALNHGIPLKAVQKIVGHTTLGSTASYLDDLHQCGSIDAGLFAC